MTKDNTVMMEGVRIIFRNFSGKESQYNREGDRNFAVLLGDDVDSLSFWWGLRTTLALLKRLRML